MPQPLTNPSASNNPTTSASTVNSANYTCNWRTKTARGQPISGCSAGTQITQGHTSSSPKFTPEMTGRMMPSPPIEKRFRLSPTILTILNISANSTSGTETVRTLSRHGIRWSSVKRAFLRIMIGWHRCLMLRIFATKPSLQVERRLNWHPMPTAIVRRWRDGSQRTRTTTPH